MLPWAGPLFIAVTQLGSELFYVVLILTGYWAVRKREAIVTMYVLLVSVVLNFWLKALLAVERPPQSYWYEGVSASNYSTPSGHSQNSVVLFGWLSRRVGSTAAVVVSTVLVVLIGVSRVYLGVHYLGDVILGWGIGLCLLVLQVVASGPVSRWVSTVPDTYLYGGMFLFGLLSTLVTDMVFSVPSDNFGAVGGLIMGAAVGLPAERRLVGFQDQPTVDRWRLVLRVVLGLLLVIGVMVGLSSFLASEYTWARALRYAVTAVVGIVVWPAAFTRLHI